MRPSKFQLLFPQQTMDNSSVNSIDAIHVCLEGLTAFFKHPLTVTGTQMSLPTPPYSTLLGFISACAGRVISPQDTRIGFEFRCVSTDAELEKTDRLVIDERGNLKSHPQGQGILKRFIHFRPRLDLYLTNTSLISIFENPVSSPSLGRSQDLVWISNIESVKLLPMDSGNIGPTLMSAENVNVPSLFVRCPEWFLNNVKGMTRIVGPVGFYQAILPTVKKRIKVKMDNLYHPTNFQGLEDVIYLHRWLEEEN